MPHSKNRPHRMRQSGRQSRMADNGPKRGNREKPASSFGPEFLLEEK